MAAPNLVGMAMQSAQASAVHDGTGAPLWVMRPMRAIALNRGRRSTPYASR